MSQTATRAARGAWPVERFETPKQCAGHVVHLSSSPVMAPRLPEFAVRVRELGFDELIINPPWEDLVEAEKPIGHVKTAVSTSGSS